LVTELGKRDFKNTITDEDEKYMDENDGWFPDRIHDIYESYEKEFDKYGLKNVVVNFEGKKAI
jgi:hypothetical protein